MDDRSFQKILDRFDLSWQGYRRVRKGVKRRLARHMAQWGCHDIAGYLDFLDRNPEEANRAKELLSVPISRFFRDLRLWEVIDDRVIPDLAQSRGEVRAWFAGCACGEEVYSFKIFWFLAEEVHLDLPLLDIVATDINPAVLEKARAGVYTPSSLRELRAPILQRFFETAGEGYSVKDPLKQGICWMVHDFIKEESPGESFDIVFLRNNLLTYYSQKLQVPAFSKIVDALRPGGILVIGNNERLPAGDWPLGRDSDYKFLFRKNG